MPPTVELTTLTRLPFKVHRLYPNTIDSIQIILNISFVLISEEGHFAVVTARKRPVRYM